MRILNSDPLPTQKDSRYMVSFIKDEFAVHLYNLYFINNSDESIVKLEVKRNHTWYDDYIEGYCSSFISEKLIDNIKPYEKVLIDKVNEYERNVEDFEFIFTIPFEEESVSFTKSINRKSLIPNLMGRPAVVSNVCYEHYIPYVTVTPLKHKECKVLTRAKKIAAYTHLQQMKRKTDIPYITHPTEVAEILAENGCSEEMQAAGVLHDVLESTDVTAEEIRDLFGDDILSVVLGTSEQDKSLSWKERKQQTLEYLAREADMGILLVSCADRLSNMRSIYRDHIALGDRVWGRFNAGYEEQKWYYQSLLYSLKDVYKFNMYDELHSLVRKVFGKFTPPFQVVYNMKTVDSRIGQVDSSLILDASWGCKYAITTGLGKIIEEFELPSSTQLDDDIKKKMDEIVEYSKQDDREDYLNMPNELWVGTVRVFYILSSFLLSYHYLTQNYVRQGITQWYMMLDSDC